MIQKTPIQRIGAGSESSISYCRDIFIPLQFWNADACTACFGGV